ncbi:hypothetical protein [Rhodopseudomonas sp. B29]|uniref:hypothetical protein n=1 Tax=Rhodopseudomonas sp. B29 TaxID=95607 RepID=UPI0003B54472|nr:hypothetical protein [Rhodopseudomonas sp. B29]
MYLGIEQQTGLVYVGSNIGLLMPAVPIPIVTRARLIRNLEDWNKAPTGPVHWVLREDTFDPVTRTRRGRLYETDPQFTQPTNHYVVPHPYEDPFGRQEGPGGRTSKSLFFYKTCRSLLVEEREGLGLIMALGNATTVSGWRIIQAEIDATGCLIVTLKALSAFGILPNLDTAKVPSDLQKVVRQAYERVLNSAFRESPISVIDHCRNAMTVFLSAWLVSQSHDRSILACDLSKVAKEVEGAPHHKAALSWSAKIVARFHSRGKDNEMMSKGLRALVDEDAAFALEALGLVMRELGWAEG